MIINRRQTLKAIAAGGLTVTANALSAIRSTVPLPVAAVVTTYYRNSHADVLCGKIMEGWRQDGGAGPNLKLAAIYTDQVHARDLSRSLAERHGVHIATTIDDALTLGTDQLAVGGVLSIGEHGDYPSNAIGQVKYPRRRFFDQIADTMKRCGKVVPVFSDKHLSWSWKDALNMYERARQQKIPFMAGSSLPVTWRFPATEIPIGTEMEEVVTVGYGGIEAYGFHALEAMQCIIERRRGGESGVASVSAVPVEKIPEWLEKHPAKRNLLKRAIRAFNGNAERLTDRLSKDSALFCLKFRDGAEATIAMLNGICDQFATAVRLRDQGRVVPIWHRLEYSHPYGHFEHLLRAIESMFHSGEPAWPVERTLLTTGVLDRAMHCLNDEGTERHVETPELAIRYQPSPWGYANRSGLPFPE